MPCASASRERAASASKRRSDCRSFAASGEIASLCSDNLRTSSRLSQCTCQASAARMSPHDVATNAYVPLSSDIWCFVSSGYALSRAPHLRAFPSELRGLLRQATRQESQTGNASRTRTNEVRSRKDRRPRREMLNIWMRGRLREVHAFGVARS